MKYLTIFTVLLVAHFVRIFPPLETSRSLGANVVKGILAAVSGGCLGFGWAQALLDVLLK